MDLTGKVAVATGSGQGVGPVYATALTAAGDPNLRVQGVRRAR